MNAASRVFVQGIVIPRSPAAHLFAWLATPYAFIFSLLTTLLIISALGVITLSDENRKLLGQASELQQTTQKLKITDAQLLLEQNTWAAPQRINAIATQQLAMQQPTTAQVIIVTV